MTNASDLRVYACPEREFLIFGYEFSALQVGALEANYDDTSPQNVS